jgi:hypothetical protein
LASKGGEDASSKIITRSEMFWLEDGDMTFQSKDGKQFRVHKGPLAMHLAFFSDMFATVADRHEKLTEGCPVVKTQDETEDWVAMLSLFYYPYNVRYQNVRRH